MNSALIPDPLRAAYDLIKAGSYDQALALWRSATAAPQGDHPAYAYTLAFLHDKLGKAGAANEARLAAAAASATGWIPTQPQEEHILADASTKNPDDPRASQYLGNYAYHRHRFDEAITLWEKSCKLDRSVVQVWRNLGIGYFNFLHDKNAAKGAYQRAFKYSFAEIAAEETSGVTANLAGDANILFERDQLWKLLHEAPRVRLDELELFPQLVESHDGLTLEYVALLNQTQYYRRAVEILATHLFPRVDGNNALAIEQWTRAHVGEGRRSLWMDATPTAKKGEAALALFTAGITPPHTVEKNSAPTSELHYWIGMSRKAMGDSTKAQAAFDTAATSLPKNAAESPTAASNTYWSAEALRELDRTAEARILFDALIVKANEVRAPQTAISVIPRLDAVNPFVRDASATQTALAALLEALGRYGLNGSNGADRRTARRLLNDLVRDDPNDLLATDLLIALDWSA